MHKPANNYRLERKAKGDKVIYPAATSSFPLYYLSRSEYTYLRRYYQEHRFGLGPLTREVKNRSGILQPRHYEHIAKFVANSIQAQVP